MIHTGTMTLALCVLAQFGSLKSSDGVPYQAFRKWQFDNDAGWLAFRSGNLTRAEERFKAAIEDIHPYEKADPRLLARSYCDLAQVLIDQSRYDQAEPLAKWALTVREKHPRIQAEAIYQNLYVLAQIHCAQRRFADAEPLLRRALALQEKALGDNQPALATTLDDLAWVVAELGKLSEADSLYKRALAIFTRTLPANHLDIAATSEHYAVLLRRMNRLTEAEWLEARARTIRSEAATAAPRQQTGRPVPRNTDRLRHPL
jgi:tetratricopeptide (TPR) repeat protein